MHDETAAKNPLGTEPIGRLACRYAIPSIISIVINSLYNMVDQVFIGQKVGYLGNAATNVIMPLTTILIAVGLMIGNGAATAMGLNLGKGNEEAAAHGVGNAIFMTVGAGIILAALFELLLTPLCWLFGATDRVLPYALEYGRIIVLGFPFSIICCSFSDMIRADGRPRKSMMGLLIGCITNIILDAIFIFIFQWGVRGAALATVIGQMLNAIYFIFCIRSCKTIRLRKENLRLKLSVSREVLSLGVSSFITQIAGVVVMAVINNSLVIYGALSRYGADIPLAALGVTMKVNQLVTGVALGIATGVQPILSYNYGSRAYDRVKKTYWTAMISTTVVLTAAFLVFQIWPETLARLFGEESELYMEFAVLCFRVYMLACFMIGVGVVTGILFQSVGKPVQSAVLSLTRQVLLLIPAVLLFGWLGGVEGILWAGPFSDGVSGILSLIVVKIYWNKLFMGNKEKNRCLPET